MHFQYQISTQLRLLAVLRGNITIHPARKDRRHIVDRDVRILAGRMNLEMAVTMKWFKSHLMPSLGSFAWFQKKREELTTEGETADVVGQQERQSSDRKTVSCRY